MASPMSRAVAGPHCTIAWEFEKTLLASDLVAVFRAQSTSWGDQMNLVFGNAIRAFLESSEGAPSRMCAAFCWIRNTASSFSKR